MNAPARSPGPWTHRDVRARGISFHVVIAGDDPTRPTVVLLHDFPLHWWSWRSQISALAEAGYRVLAVDLRGLGGSDLQPGPVELDELARDVIAVCDATGTASYSVVGSGLGGAVAWTIAHLDPPGLRSVVTVCAPHPLTRHRRSASPTGTAGRVDRELGIPFYRSRRLQDGTLVRSVLTTWCAPESADQMASLAPHYAASFQRSTATKAALETQKAARRPSSSAKEALEGTITVPVWSIRGGADRRVSRDAYSEDVTHAHVPITHLEIAEAGHFPNEETPDQLTALLRAHLTSVYERGGAG